MKRLIVNADDFGMAESVNEGIVRGHREGILTSASLLAGGRAAAHAAGLAKENPDLGVGLHLCLTLEMPCAPLEKIPSLARGGKLPSGPFEFMMRFMSGSITTKDVTTELRAQVEKALSLGIRPTHLDGHQHLYVMPGIFPIVLQIAKEHDIGAVRFPVGPWLGMTSPPRVFEKFVLEGLAGLQGRLLYLSGVKHPDRFLGLPETGRLDAEKLLRIIEGLPDGVSELMCHPGLPNDSLAKEIRWGYGWGRELAAVTDPRIREAVKARGIELVNFKQI